MFVGALLEKLKLILQLIALIFKNFNCTYFYSISGALFSPQFFVQFLGPPLLLFLLY